MNMESQILHECVEEKQQFSLHCVSPTSPKTCQAEFGIENQAVEKQPEDHWPLAWTRLRSPQHLLL